MTDASTTTDVASDREVMRQCPPELFDGWAVHAAAMRRGQTTWLLSGQALMTGSDAGRLGELAFAHGVPRESQLSMATLVQDKRIRRSILEDHNIPVPKGATFTVGRGTGDARRFASRIGYPLVMKPMVGDNTIETRRSISSNRDLLNAIRYFKTAPPYRPNHISSSYAFTAIQTPREEGSRQTRDNYRVLIEQELPGDYLRTLSVNGALVSAVYAPTGAWGYDPGGRDVLPDLHNSVKEFVGRVVAAFSGLSVLAVDLVVSEAASVPLSEQNVTVVEVSERPWLYLQQTYAPDNVIDLADAIVQGSAKHNGVGLPTVHNGTVSCYVRWEGVPDERSFFETLKTYAADNHLTGWAEMEDRIGGVASGHLQGSPGAIALLGELAVAGQLDSDAVMSMEATPTPYRPLSGFETGMRQD